MVNTRRPGEFSIRRKTDADEVTPQDATATNVQVPLDQHFYTSFVIKDGEASKSFKELVDIYVLPGMQTIARSVDRALLGRIHEFLGGLNDRVGRLGNLSDSNAKDYVLDARKRLNDNKAPVVGRRLLLGSSSETAMLKTDLFLKANERGDGGAALEDARLGRILGFDTFMSQNVNDVSSTSSMDTVSGTVTNAAAAGTTGSQTVSISGYEVQVGEYVIVAGNDQPTYATAATVATNTTAVTLNEALKYATAAGATITAYKSHDVNGAYAAGYSKGITLDGHTNPLQVGQLVSFGTGASRKTYTVIEVQDDTTTYTVWLDRPLEVALADNDLAFPGPAGAFNWAFHRDAIALVTRPLVIPNRAMGALGGIAAHNNVAMRVTMQYEARKQGTLVTMDILGGVAVLDDRLCVPLLG